MNECKYMQITVPQLFTCSSYMQSVHVYKSQSNEQMQVPHAQ